MIVAVFQKDNISALGEVKAQITTQLFMIPLSAPVGKGRKNTQIQMSGCFAFTFFGHTFCHVAAIMVGFLPYINLLTGSLLTVL